jgi:hypothetical protein
MLKILNMTRLIFARPECDIRGPRLIARVRWTIVFCGIVSFLVGSSSLAQAAQSVMLARNPGTSVGAGHCLHYGTSRGNSVHTIEVGYTTTATVSNLKAGQTHYFVISAYNAPGLEKPPSNEVFITVSPAPTQTRTLTQSLFSASAAPSNAQQTWNDNTPVELGVKFQTSAAGTVTGIRFYKTRKNTSAHVGNLWSATGTLLATTKFTNETDSGWQQVNLSRPVTLTPRTTYIVSYHTTVYSADENYFAGAHTRGPLTAQASSASGGNGVYAYGSSSSFPSRSYKSSNYWVDVAFLEGQLTAGAPQSKLRHK